MQKRQEQSPQQNSHLFTASEVAEFEYCPLTWWYGQFEAAAQADTEELFAHLVKLEHQHGAQAPAIPEYQMIEQLLVRRGAFEKGRQQHAEHAEEVAELEEERIPVPARGAYARRLILIALIILAFALLLIVAGAVIR